MLRRIAAIALSLIAAACFPLKPAPVGGASDAATATLGTIHVSSPRIGEATIVPTGCTSGARQYFLGGDFIDAKSGMAVRLAVDPIGSPAIKVFPLSDPFNKSVTFRREECSVFHFSLDSTGWRVNHIDDYRITLNVDCARDGESVRGTASTTHCY